MIVGSLLLILVAVVLLVLGLTNGSSGMLIGSIGASLLAAVALVVGARQDTAGRADEGYLDDGPDDRLRGDADEPAYADPYAVVGARTGRTGQRPAGAGLGGTGYAPSAPPSVPPAQAEFPTVTLPAQPAYPPPREAPPGEPVREAVREPVREAPPADPPAGTGAVPGTGVPGGVPAEAGYDDEDPPDEPAPQAVSPADAARVARLTTDVLVIDGRPRYHLPGCVHLLGREGEPLPVGEAAELGFTPCSLCEPASALLTDPRHG